VCRARGGRKARGRPRIPRPRRRAPRIEKHLEAEARARVDVAARIPRTRPSASSTSRIPATGRGRQRAAEVLPAERAAEETGHVTPCAIA